MGGLGGLVSGLLGVLGAFLQCGEFLLRLLRGLLGLVRLVESLLVHVGSRIQRVLVGKKLLTVIVHGNTTGVQILLGEVLCCGQGTRDGEAGGVAIRVDDVQIMSGLLVDVRILHVDFHGGHIAQFRILLRIPVEHGLLLGIPAVIRIIVTPSEVLGGSGEHVSRVRRVRVVVCGELRVDGVHVVDGPFRQSEATANLVALVNQVERLEHVLQAGRGALVPNLHPVLVLVFDEHVERMLGVLVRIVGSKLPLVEADGTGCELLVSIVGGGFLRVRVGLCGVGGRGLRVRVLLLLADAVLRVRRVLVGRGLRGVGVVLRGQRGFEFGLELADGLLRFVGLRLRVRGCLVGLVLVRLGSGFVLLGCGQIVGLLLGFLLGLFDLLVGGFQLLGGLVELLAGVGERLLGFLLVFRIGGLTGVLLGLVQVLLSLIDGGLRVLRLLVGSVQSGLGAVHLGLGLVDGGLRVVNVGLRLIQIGLGFIVFGLGFVHFGLCVRLGVGLGVGGLDGLSDGILSLGYCVLRLFDGTVHVRLDIVGIICERGGRCGERRDCHGRGDECFLDVCQDSLLCFGFSTCGWNLCIIPPY